MKLEKYLGYYRKAQSYLYCADFWPKGISRTKATKNFKAFCEALEADWKNNATTHPNLPPYGIVANGNVIYIQWPKMNFALFFYFNGNMQSLGDSTNKTIKQMVDALLERAKG